MKAFLQKHDTPFPKTHDLDRLIQLCAAVNADFISQEDGLTFLADFSVRFRYPGSSADAMLAKEALKRATDFRISAKNVLSGADST